MVCNSVLVRRLSALTYPRLQRHLSSVSVVCGGRKGLMAKTYSREFQQSNILVCKGAALYGYCRTYSNKTEDGSCNHPDLEEEIDELFLTPEEDALVKVEYDEDDKGNKTGVCVVSFNVPEKLNPMTVKMGQVFQKKLRYIRKDPDINCMVLTGKGKAFSAGGDMKFLEQRTRENPTQNTVTMRHFYDRFLTIRRMPFPIIAAINGHAVGAGFCVALACDLRVASEEAKMGVNFVKIGFSPGMGGTHFLPYVSNPQIAARLILTGELVNGVQAKEMGLVLDAYPKDQVVNEAVKLARQIASNSPTALKMVLPMLRSKGESFHEGLSSALDEEAKAQAHCYNQTDIKEGLNSIKEKRDPDYRNLKK